MYLRTNISSLFIRSNVLRTDLKEWPLFISLITYTQYAPQVSSRKFWWHFRLKCTTGYLLQNAEIFPIFGLPPNESKKYTIWFLATIACQCNPGWSCLSVFTTKENEEGTSIGCQMQRLLKNQEHDLIFVQSDNRSLLSWLIDNGKYIYIYIYWHNPDIHSYVSSIYVWLSPHSFMFLVDDVINSLLEWKHNSFVVGRSTYKSFMVDGKLSIIHGWRKTVNHSW